MTLTSSGIERDAELAIFRVTEYEWFPVGLTEQMRPDLPEREIT